MTTPQELPPVDPINPFVRGRIIRPKGTEPENGKYLPRNTDLGLPDNIKNSGTADFYARKLNIPIDEVQRLYSEEREKFLQLLDQHQLRVAIRPEDL